LEADGDTKIYSAWRKVGVRTSDPRTAGM